MISSVPVGIISAIVLAAGRSSRMGRPKLVLPWGEKTVIEQVVTVLIDSGLEDIFVVTGGAMAEVEIALRSYPLRIGFNPDFAQSEMLSSLQIGLRFLKPETNAVLIVLGDQPFIEKETVINIIDLYNRKQARIVVPSYKMHKGHPWLVHRSLFDELIQLGHDQTLRQFLAMHTSEISYLQVDTPSVVKDIDTPEDYDRERPA